jgi:hypothetical protein
VCRGLGLSEAEIKLLLDAFGKKMRHGAVHVQWRAFVAEIEKVFQTSNMEKDPTSGPAWRTVEQQPKTLSPPAREYAVQKLLADLRQRVAVRRVLVKPLFADYGSPLSSTKTQDHVTRQNLVQSLSRFDIHLDEPEQQLLFDRYDTLDAGSVNMVRRAPRCRRRRRSCATRCRLPHRQPPLTSRVACGGVCRWRWCATLMHTRPSRRGTTCGTCCRRTPTTAQCPR